MAGDDERVEVRPDLVLPVATGGGSGALLREASFIGATSLVKALLDEGKVNPREADEQATTALHMATKGGHKETADLLQRAGSSTSLPNAVGGGGFMIKCARVAVAHAAVALARRIASPGVFSRLC